jgi:hypothetical protein
MVGVLLGISGFTMFQMTSCIKEKVATIPLNTTCADTISFQTTIGPLITTNCSTSGCHDASQAAGYKLLTHAEIAADASKILQVIRHEPGVSPMPQGASKLSATAADEFNCWILQGKKNN